MAARPVRGAPPGFGREVAGPAGGAAAPGALLAAVHAHGFVVVRRLGDLDGAGLAAALRRLFPSLDIAPFGFYDHQVQATGEQGMFVKTLDLDRVGGQQFVAMGNVVDDNGKYLIDYQHPEYLRHGVRVEDPSDGSWTPQLEACLRDWHTRGQRCGFMEWHTDQTSSAVRPAYAAIYCKRPGGSATAFADTTAGLRSLPQELREVVDGAVCEHRFRRGVPGPKHRMVQRHAHTGAPHLCFNLGARVGDLPRRESDELTWRVMRHVTRSANTYFHTWEAGDLILWDQRGSFHSRVPYDLNPRDPREVWRVSFMPDAAEWRADAARPQLNLTRTRPTAGAHTSAVWRYLDMAQGPVAGKL